MNEQARPFDGLHAASHLRLGERATVRAVEGGRFMVQRMGMLGIRPGVHVCVVHGPSLRGAVLLVGGTRIALGHEVIEHIRVETLPASHQGADVL